MKPGHEGREALSGVDSSLPRRQAALEYATRGYGVFPCKPNEKAPATRHGLRDATLDAATLERWWRDMPRANVGLLPPANVLVIDADSRGALASWQERYPELANAPLARTPRDGGHLYLAMPEGATAPPTATRIGGEPVDVRGLGKAYLVAPPSSTPAGFYTWERPLVTPETLPTASAELLQALTPKRCGETPQSAYSVLPTPGQGRDRRYALAALQAEHDAVAGAPEGSRNQMLNKAAFALGQLVGALERAEVEDALSAAAATCGLPEGEAAATIRSGIEAGVREPRKIPPKTAARARSYRSRIYDRMKRWRNGRA